MSSGDQGAARLDLAELERYEVRRGWVVLGWRECGLGVAFIDPCLAAQSDFEPTESLNQVRHQPRSAP